MTARCTGIIDVDHVAPTVAQLLDAQNRGGLQAVLAKVTQGRDYHDPGWFGTRRAADALGLPLKGYAFGSNSSSGRQQARFLVSEIGLQIGGALDWEWNPDHEGGDMPLDHAEEFADEFSQITGKLPLVYTSLQWVQREKGGANRPKPDSILGRCPLWLCWYGPPGAMVIPAPWTEAALVQYTNGRFGPSDTATFPRAMLGLGRRVDRSYFNGTPEQLQEWWKR